MSTLLPITPPRIPPTAAPMRPPFTLFRLVVAPMTAPAAAPIAASRCVFFSTVPPLDRVVVVACRVVPDDVVVRRVLATSPADVLLRVAAAPAVARSAALRLSNGWYPRCCAASERSV